MTAAMKNWTKGQCWLAIAESAQATTPAEGEAAH